MPAEPLPSTEATWERVVSRLRHDPVERLNTFEESCERWSADRGRLACVVRHADGSSERWTYHELARAATRAAAMLAALGLRRGDRVASVLTRQVEAWIVALAAWRQGLVSVPLFVGFGASSLETRLRASGADAVVVDHRWRATVEEALTKLDADLAVITVAGPRGTGVQRGDLSLWAELERPLPVPDAALTTASDPATLMFTSGTTSEPKACVLPHGGLVSLVPYVEHSFGVSTRDLLFATSDPGWSFGLYTTGCVPMSLGVPRLVYSGDFDPRAWLSVMAAEDVTFVSGAPTAFRRLLDTARRTGWPSSLRGAGSAGEPLDAETARGWQDSSGTPLLDGYGLTEVGMILANRARPPTPVKPGWLAGPVPGFEVQLRDDDGEPVGTGEEGTLAIRRPPFQLSSGYENAPDAWARRWQDDWYVTDDVFVTDDEGRFHFRGRADDVIVTAGYNVGPVEIESVLLAHDDVLEAAAVASPDPQRGTIVRAVVVAAAGADRQRLTEELQQAVRERVGRHAYPRQVDFVDVLPRTATGKVRRAELRRAAGASPENG